MTRTAAAFALLLAACSAPEAAQEAEGPGIDRSAGPVDPHPIVGKPVEEVRTDVDFDPRRYDPGEVVARVDAAPRSVAAVPGADRTAGPVDPHPIVGNAVEWTRTEVGFDPSPFETGDVVARADYVDRGSDPSDRPSTMRVGLTVTGLPSDVLFLELDTSTSEVSWTDGARGTLREIEYQVGPARVMTLGVLTSAPPAFAAIKRLQLVLTVHQLNRAVRSEARIGTGDAAAFACGSVRFTWSLSTAGHVIEDAVPRYDPELIPASERARGWNPRVQIVDAKGRDLWPSGGMGLGPTMLSRWELPDMEPAAGPVRVTVAVPLETATRRIVVNLTDLRPDR